MNEEISVSLRLDLFSGSSDGLQDAEAANAEGPGGSAARTAKPFGQTSLVDAFLDVKERTDERHQGSAATGLSAHTHTCRGFKEKALSTPSHTRALKKRRH